MDLDFDPISDEVFCEMCMSILHFTLNTFKHLCNVGAKIKANVKEFPARGPVKQAKIKLAAERIKKNFDELGMNMFDKRRAGSNPDGNSARIAFRNTAFFAQNVGLSETLIWRFNVIRIALASTKQKGSIFSILAFPPILCAIKFDVSGITV